MKKRGPWTTLSERIAYETPWISVSHHEVIDPGGKHGVYGVIHFKSLAVGVIPLDEEMNTWIVGQYRYPMEAYSWEMPEGGGDRNAPAVESAKRELREEVGIEAEHWTEILQMDLSNSASDEGGDLRGTQLTFPRPGAAAGEVRDSLTVAAVLKVRLMMFDGKLGA